VATRCTSHHRRGAAPRRPVVSAVVAVVMARKKHSASSGARALDATRRQAGRSFSEWYFDRIFKPDFYLAIAHYGWMNQQTPYYVWAAIDFCTRAKIGFPDWVNRYLAECAERMLSPDSTKSRDLRKVLPEIMGFPRKKPGPGHLLDPDPEWRYGAPAWRFAVQIEKGEKPTAALRDAFDVLDPVIGDKMEAETLLAHIKRYFCITNAPRTNAEWKQALRAKVTEAFAPFLEEFREIAP